MKNTEYNITLPAGLPILVTGSTGGIGKEIVRAIAPLGHPLILPCRNKKKFETLSKEIREEFPDIKLQYIPLNLNDSRSVEAAVNELKNIRLAGIINNAGIMCRHFVISPDGRENTLNVNYFNTMLLNNGLLSQVETGGALVFTTSITRIFVPKRATADSVSKQTFGQLKTYALSKKLITDYAMALASETSAHSIRINCCDPGVVNSGMITMHRWYDHLADIFFRPFIRTASNGARPAVRALLSPLTGRIFTLRRSHRR